MNKVTMNKRPVEEISEVEPPLKKFVEYHGNKENNPRNSSSLIISTDPFDDDSGFLEDKIVSHKPISLKQSTPFIKKQKRVRLNIEDQYKVLDMYDKTKNAEQIAKDTKIPKSTVWNIIRRRPKIEGVMSYGSKKYVKTVKSVREATHPDVDKAVWLWFLGERKRASIISNEILMAQARYFHENLCDKDDFKGSRGWCRAFKLKRGIRQLKITGEKLLIEKAWNSLDKSIIIQSWKALLCDTPFYQNLLMNDQKSDYISEDFKSIVRLLEKVSIHVPNNVGPENIMEWLNRMDENQTHVIYDKTEILNLIKGIKPSSTHEEENDDSQEDFINDSSKMNDDNITIVETDEYRLKEKKEGRKALESLEHLENYFKDRNSHSNVLILNKLREEIEENIFSVYIDEI
uniref:CSON002100 protein n=1 Tax=Culicoides sonorensis TaxID=179676 RepID=A0A336MPE4_CULSO